MEHVCTNVLFRFWNGKTQYTVAYVPSLSMWYVFNGEETENCLAEYPLDQKLYAINHHNAKFYLKQYLEYQKVD